MLRNSCILTLVLIVLFQVQFTTTKRFTSGRHSYPKSGGLSGGGSHHYPPSGGLSGSGHGSGGSHTYPSSGGSHTHPSSGGLSGGGHGYPQSGKGLSGNSHTGSGHTTTNIHHHYHYNPPQQIRYVPPSGGHAVTYPVYRGSPPTYVYQYKDSGSKYGTLLAGLALLNLGTLGVSAYALSKSQSNYKPKAGEVCKFGIKKDNGDYEETRIDCNLMSSFIYEEESKMRSGSGGTNTTVVTVTVTNVTTTNITNGETTPTPEVLYKMLPNGTLVPVNATNSNANTTLPSNTTSDGTVSSSVTVTNTTTVTTNALDVKGKPVDVTPGMQCFVISHSPVRDLKKTVPCGVLQSYADQSLKKNSASRNIPMLSILGAVIAVLLTY